MYFLFFRVTLHFCGAVTLFLLLHNNTLAQKKVIGLVLNKQNGTPVPFAVITDEKKHWGTNSDENGQFIIENTSIGDTLVVACLGYFEYKIPFSKWEESTTVYLIEKSIKLSEVVVENKRKKHKIWLGSLEKKTTFITGQLAHNEIQEMALLIPNYLQVDGYIEKVGFWIDRFGAPKTPFRVRVYKNNNGFPGEDLLIENLITHAKSGNRWFDIEIGKYNIPFPNEGFFIAMEWINTKNPKYAFKVEFPNKVMKTYYGQHIGKTKEFNEYNGRIRNNNGDWKIDRKHRIFKNPMMRAQIQVYE
ncbi:carboxypeptidase-like regulatory domain-containing protein [Runella sp.]|jgi:hypothetical protein|uniref:carboxypeptidase-like regulatory domain-containing protein n=1 Tax=Runella sp. TaxID=1960881 RepID=UPI003018B5D6